MVKLTVLYGHPKDAAHFENYYLNTHTPIALKVAGVRRFEISKALPGADGGKPPYHRIADLYFDDMAALQSALSSPQGQAAADDIGNFATGGATFLIAEGQDLSAR